MLSLNRTRKVQLILQSKHTRTIAPTFSTTKKDKSENPSTEPEWRQQLTKVKNIFNNTYQTAAQKYKELDKYRHLYQDKVQYRQLILGFSGAAFLGASNIVYYSSWFSQGLSPQTSLHLGVFCGISISTVLYSSYVMTTQSFQMNPEAMVQSSLKIIKSKKKLMENLGPHLDIESLKSYSSTGFGAKFQNGKVHFSKPEMNLHFVVKGNENEAIVSAMFEREIFQDKCVYIGLNSSKEGLSMDLIGADENAKIHNDMIIHAQKIVENSSKTVL